MTCCYEGCGCRCRSHQCEPPYYPTALGEQWTCPECGRTHEAFDPADSVYAARFPIPDGALGWHYRSSGAPS